MEHTTTSRSATGGSLAAAVVALVADCEGVEPTELSPPLYEVIDPDALNAVFSPTKRGPSRGHGRLEFEYCGREVVVHSTGHVAVGDSEARSEDETTDRITT